MVTWRQYNTLIVTKGHYATFPAKKRVFTVPAKNPRCLLIVLLQRMVAACINELFSSCWFFLICVALHTIIHIVFRKISS